MALEQSTESRMEWLYMGDEHTMYAIENLSVDHLDPLELLSLFEEETGEVAAVTSINITQYIVTK